MGTSVPSPDAMCFSNVDQPRRLCLPSDMFVRDHF
jgi:hypothetical protein